jgi:hypothetical protein
MKVSGVRFQASGWVRMKLHQTKVSFSIKPVTPGAGGRTETYINYQRVWHPSGPLFLGGVY